MLFVIHLTWSLLQEAWSLLYRSIGTTPLGYWLPVLISFGPFAIGCFRNRHDFMEHVKRNFRGGFIVALVVWSLLYVFDLYQVSRAFLNPVLTSRQIPPGPPPEPPPPPPIFSHASPPEVVLAADKDITYVLIWIPGTKTFPTVQPAGKSGYPAMELKNLSGSPVTGVSIEWSVAGPPIEKVVRSSEHFRKYVPIVDHGMYWMDNGEGVGIPVEDRDHSDIPYVADSTVPVDIPGGIWDNFFLRMVATVERPADNSPPPPIKTFEPVATAVLKYHQSNQIYIRTFQIKALVFVIPNGALLAALGTNGDFVGEIGKVDVAHWSPDNLRAQVRFSISQSFGR
jgi:hypothetical protein